MKNKDRRSGGFVGGMGEEIGEIGRRQGWVGAGSGGRIEKMRKVKEEAWREKKNKKRKEII